MVCISIDILTQARKSLIKAIADTIGKEKLDTKEKR